MDDKVLDFWRQHSVNFLEMALKNDKLERVRQPDGYGKHIRECGDSLEIFINLRDDRISSASFYTEGCIYTVACANTIVRMVEGKPPEQAWAITPRDVIEYLQTLPVKERHCAELAVTALRAALTDLKETQRQPWVKFYRESGSR